MLWQKKSALLSWWPTERRSPSPSVPRISKRTAERPRRAASATRVGSTTGRIRQKSETFVGNRAGAAAGTPLQPSHTAVPHRLPCQGRACPPYWPDELIFWSVSSALAGTLSAFLIGIHAAHPRRGCRSPTAIFRTSTHAGAAILRNRPT